MTGRSPPQSVLGDFHNKILLEQFHVGTFLIPHHRAEESMPLLMDRRPVN